MMGYFHEVQIFTNAALLAVAEIFTTEKFTSLSPRNQHFIYGSFVVCITQLATTRDHDLYYRVTINTWLSCVQLSP